MASAEATSWWHVDPARLAREQQLLRKPWKLVERGDGRLSWTGGSVGGERWTGIKAPTRAVELIYPTGFPARFIEARLLPELPRSKWGMVGAHVNLDGSACYVAGEGWWPQMTVQDAVELLEVWWFNYWVVIDHDLSDALRWPPRGRVRVPEVLRAVVRDS